MTPSAYHTINYRECNIKLRITDGTTQGCRLTGSHFRFKSWDTISTLSRWISPTAATGRSWQAAANANLWHRRLRHRNRKGLDLLRNLGNNGASFDGPVPDCDVYTVN